MNDCTGTDIIISKAGTGTLTVVTTGTNAPTFGTALGNVDFFLSLEVTIDGLIDGNNGRVSVFDDTGTAFYNETTTQSSFSTNSADHPELVDGDTITIVYSGPRFRDIREDRVLTGGINLVDITPVNLAHPLEASADFDSTNFTSSRTVYTAGAGTLTGNGIALAGDFGPTLNPVSYTHLTLPTTPYV